MRMGQCSIVPLRLSNGQPWDGNHPKTSSPDVFVSMAFRMQMPPLERKAAAVPKTLPKGAKGNSSLLQKFCLWRTAMKNISVHILKPTGSLSFLFFTSRDPPTTFALWKPLAGYSKKHQQTHRIRWLQCAAFDSPPDLAHLRSAKRGLWGGGLGLSMKPRFDHSRVWKRQKNTIATKQNVNAKKNSKTQRQAETSKLLSNGGEATKEEASKLQTVIKKWPPILR